MERITSVSEMRSWADRRRKGGRRIALVPTMGALHEGHLALVRKAAELADDVVVSIFVNPTQFGPGEDFERYPRSLERDVDLLEGIDSQILLFVPTVSEMYPGGADHALTWVEVHELGRYLCGQFREGHFRGVTTVVLKLLHACKPDAAVFGLKDAQQFVILRRMVQDLLLDVEIVGVPVIREPDGLAYSSRNAYLSASQRASSTALSKAVHEAKRRILGGEQRPQAVVEAMRSILERGGSRLEGDEDLEIQYAEVVDAETLRPVAQIVPGQYVLAAVAVFFDETRLIDSVFVHAPHTP